MCGICGIHAKRPASMDEISTLCRKMMARMRHRGPDDEGFYADEKHHTALGHCRLSILDLSPAGRQPLFNENQSLAVIVNGEIYNYRELRDQLAARGHRFSSQSDSETIVHGIEEEGTSFWPRLRGMYAAAVYDAKTGTLELARDPLGIKPLYIYEDDRWIAFASEVRAFDAFGTPDFDLEGIADFLLLGSVPSPRTHRRGVRALRPGERVVVENGSCFSDWRQVMPEFCVDALQKKISVEEMAGVLWESVSKHLASDVPIGIFLSGGIDSGTLAGVATESSMTQIHTVSVSLPGHELDESRFALQTAQTYGTAHTDVKLERDEFERDLGVFLDHVDLPTIDGFNTFIVSKAARRAGLTVALSGVGGDELFNGYPTFRRAPQLTNIMRMVSWGGSWGRSAATALLGLRKIVSQGRVAAILRTCPPDLRSGWLACRGLFIGGMLEDLFLPEARDAARRAQERFFHETAWVVRRPLPTDLAIGALEFTRYMGMQLLRDTDVMSMAHSLEVRTPLVDVEVTRAALAFLAQPARGDGHPKWLLRQALKKPLPRAVVERPKQGFVFPWQEWLQGRVRQDFEIRLQEGGRWASFLDRDKLNAWKRDYDSGFAHWSYFWALYVLMRMLE